jgi:hypothetical protein
MRARLSVAKAAMPMMCGKDAGIVAVTGLRHDVKKPPVVLFYRETWRAEPHHFFTDKVFKYSLRSHNVVQETLAPHLIGKHVPISMRPDFVPRLSTASYHVGHLLGHPTQAEECCLGVGLIEQLQQPLNASLSTKRELRPLLNWGNAVTIQNVEPVLQFAAKGTDTFPMP